MISSSARIRWVSAAAIIAIVASIVVISPAPATAAPTALPFLGGFDSARGGSASFQFGVYYEQARTAVEFHYPELRLTAFGDVTTTALTDVDIIYLDASRNNSQAITPLSTDEQTQLSEWVNGGGCLILAVDNDTYDPAHAAAANASLLAPFGMAAQGNISAKVTVKVPNAALSPVTDGLYAIVGELTQNYPGALSSVGEKGLSLATNAKGAALAVIPTGALTASSGPVIVVSDTNTFSDDADQGLFLENSSLFLNTIDYCLHPGGRSISRLFSPYLVKQ
ncbi:MAG: hypothetical protein IPK16_31120 [Anaerolineales bacterium]|nr:hypothetical protein [Anaerolineales bacterium]